MARRTCKAAQICTLKLLLFLDLAIMTLESAGVKMAQG